MSYRMQRNDGTVLYQHAPTRAKVPEQMPNISGVLSGESANKKPSVEQAQAYRCSSSLHTFFYYPESRRLIVEFGNGERFLYESVSETLYNKLICEDKEGDPTQYLYTWISSKPDKHPCKRLK